MDRTLLTGCLTLALLGGGCAGQAPPSKVPEPPDTPRPADSRLDERLSAQAQRLQELETRVSLLEAEARANRKRRRTKPTETVRIGEQRSASKKEDDTDPSRARADPRPVIRIHQSDLPGESQSLPSAPPGVSDRLDVVPLPEQREAHISSRASGSPKSSAREVYRDALRLLRSRRYADSVNAFERFLARYPTHALSDNAVYWRGIAHYAQRRYEDALEQFARVLSRFPKSSKAPDSMLKAGLCHQRLGNATEATRYFELVRTRYPNSDAAQAAPRQKGSS